MIGTNHKIGRRFLSISIVFEEEEAKWLMPEIKFDNYQSDKLIYRVLKSVEYVSIIFSQQ
jgi:hypothetical protein